MNQIARVCVTLRIQIIKLTISKNATLHVLIRLANFELNSVFANLGRIFAREGLTEVLTGGVGLAFIAFTVPRYKTRIPN